MGLVERVDTLFRFSETRDSSEVALEAVVEIRKRIFIRYRALLIRSTATSASIRPKTIHVQYSYDDSLYKLAIPLRTLLYCLSREREDCLNVHRTHNR